MTLLDALAAALRDHLLAGKPAPMPGVGTLQRERVAARVEPQADGSRLLLPPSETVLFVPGAPADAAALSRSLLRALGTPGGDGPGTLRKAVDQLEGHLSAAGSAVLPGVGEFRRGQEGLTFKPDPSLLAAVAQPYEGMGPVSATPSIPPPHSERSAPTDATFVDDNTLDEDLDDVLAAPLDTPDAGLKAILPPMPPPEAPPTAAEALDPPPQAEPSPEAEDSSSDAGAALAAGALGAGAAIAAASDDTATWTPRPDPPARPDPPPPSDPAPPEPSELATPATAPSSSPTDLGWLDAYDTTDEEEPTVEPPTAEPVAAAGLGTAAAPPPPRQEPRPPVAPQPPPPSRERRGFGWLWVALPVLALVAAFLWYRAGQAPEPSDSAAVAELAAGDDVAQVAPDTLTAETAASATDTSATAEAVAADTSSASAPPPGPDDAAALDGEFTVEELAASGATSSGASPAGQASSAPARPQATSPPRSAQRPPAAQQPAASTRPVVDRPDLSDLPEADREALTGTAPIVSGRGGFSWVVLSTRERASADLRARQYREAGWRVRVFQTEALGDTVYRVALGQFDSRAQADRLRSYLPSQAPPDTWRLDLSTL